MDYLGSRAKWLMSGQPRNLRSGMSCNPKCLDELERGAWTEMDQNLGSTKLVTLHIYNRESRTSIVAGIHYRVDRDIGAMDQ